MVWVAILVSYVHVLRWQALGLIAVGGREAKKNRGTFLTSLQLTLTKRLVLLVMRAFDWLLDNGL